MPEYTQPRDESGSHAVRQLFASMAHAAAHEVLTLRELLSRAQRTGAQTADDVRQLAQHMIAERARFIGGDYPDVASDAYESAAAERALAHPTADKPHA